MAGGGGAHQKSSPLPAPVPRAQPTPSAAPLQPPLEVPAVLGPAGLRPGHRPGPEVTARARRPPAPPARGHHRHPPRAPGRHAHPGVRGTGCARATARRPRATFPTPGRGGPGAKGRRAAGARGLRRAAGPSPESESPAPCFHPGSSFLRARRPGACLPAGQRTANARGRAAPEAPAARGGAHSAPGQGGARGAAQLAPPPRAARLRPQIHTSRPGNFASLAAREGAADGRGLGRLPVGGCRAPPCSRGREWSRPAGFRAGEMKGGSPGAASSWHAGLGFARGMFAGFLLLASAAVGGCLQGCFRTCLVLLFQRGVLCRVPKNIEPEFPLQKVANATGTLDGLCYPL